MYFRTSHETVEAMRSAETLGFAYTVESYVRLTGGDEGESEWRLVLYDSWDVPEEREAENT